MHLRWLRLTQSCKLEFPSLKDYAGQPLKFMPPGLMRRCVTEEVFNHELVQRYITTRLLELDVMDKGGSAPPAAPTVVEVATHLESPPESPPEPTPEPEPEVSVSAEPTSEQAEEGLEDGSDQDDSDRSRRRKRRGNR